MEERFFSSYPSDRLDSFSFLSIGFLMFIAGYAMSIIHLEILIQLSLQIDFRMFDVIMNKS